MILYEVRLDVDATIAAAFRAWLGELAAAPRFTVLARAAVVTMREQNVPQSALPGFVRADILREERGEGRVGWCTQYWLVDRAALDAYLRDHAPRLRADGLQRFPDRFTAERRVGELEQQFDRR